MHHLHEPLTHIVMCTRTGESGEEARSSSSQLQREFHEPLCHQVLWHQQGSCEKAGVCKDLHLRHRWPEADLLLQGSWGNVTRCAVCLFEPVRLSSEVCEMCLPALHLCHRWPEADLLFEGEGLCEAYNTIQVVLSNME